MRISDWSSDVCSSDLNLGISSVEARVGKGVSGPSGARRMPCLCQIRPCGGQDDWITNPAMAQGAHCLDPRREHGGGRTGRRPLRRDAARGRRCAAGGNGGDRKSGVWGKRGAVRVDLGGGRSRKKKKKYISRRPGELNQVIINH